MQSPFIKKLKKILDDSTYSDIVCWTRQGTSIQIRDQKKFEEFVLSKFFRHAHLASFIRQLNLYGFRKVRSSHSQVFTHEILESGNRIQEICAKKKLFKIKQRGHEQKKEEVQCIEIMGSVKSQEKEGTHTKISIEKPQKIVEDAQKKQENLNPSAKLVPTSVQTPNLLQATFQAPIQNPVQTPLQRPPQNYPGGGWMYVMNPVGSNPPMPYPYPQSFPFYQWN